MIIATMKPFTGFWTSVVEEVRYFKEYGKDVSECRMGTTAIGWS